jgi:PleD family two-component response regulator
VSANNNKKVIYIDSNPAYLTLMQFIIKCRDDVDVFSANDVDQAMAQIEEVRPDLVLINVNKERCDHVQRLIDWMGEHESLRGIPAVGVCADPDLRVSQNCLCGLSEYVFGKLDVEAMLAVMVKYLDQQKVSI